MATSMIGVLGVVVALRLLKLPEATMARARPAS